MNSKWKTEPLGTLCSVQNGSSNTQDAIPDGSYVFFDRSRLPKRSNRFLFDCEAVIIAGEGSEFRPKRYSGKFDLHQRAYAIYGFGSTLMRDYLFYYLEHVHAYFQEVAVGATVKSLRQRHFQQLPVKFPTDISEQQRIVAILDQAFENIAKVKANAERNLVNASELRNQITEDLIAVKTRNSPSVPLSELAEFKNGLNFTRSSKGETIKIVGVADFKSDFWTPAELNEVQIEGHLGESYALRDNDILVVRSNGNKELIGRCILAKGIQEKTSHSGFTIRVRIRNRDIDSEYLTHFMKSAAVRRDLVSSGDGANISSLNQKALASITVPIPSLADQKALVSAINTANDQTDKLGSALRQKSAAVDEVRQSLLHQAFSGGL